MGAGRFHELRRVVTNLGVLDFETPDHRMRLRSVHPGVTVDEVVAATGFELAIAADGADSVETRCRPTRSSHLRSARSSTRRASREPKRSRPG